MKSELNTERIFQMILLFCTIKGGKEGNKCIALRADTDGLPMKEDLELP